MSGIQERDHEVIKTRRKRFEFFQFLCALCLLRQRRMSLWLSVLVAGLVGRVSRWSTHIPPSTDFLFVSRAGDVNSPKCSILTGMWVALGAICFYGSKAESLDVFRFTEAGPVDSVVSRSNVSEFSELLVVSNKSGGSR